MNWRLHAGSARTGKNRDRAPEDPSFFLQVKPSSGRYPRESRRSSFGRGNMIEPDIIDATSRRNEAVVERLFKKQGFCVKKLDRDTSGRRPDFLVSTCSDPKRSIICEVKTVVTGGSIKGVPISSLNPNMWSDLNATRCSIPPSKTMKKIDDVLAEAESQLECLLQNRPDLKMAPFVVALFLDFFADIFDILPKDFDHLAGSDRTAVSAIATVERDKAIHRTIAPLSCQQIEARLEGLSAGKKLGFPPPEKTWKLMRNRSAINRVSLDFFHPCREV